MEADSDCKLGLLLALVVDNLVQHPQPEGKSELYQIGLGFLLHLHHNDASFTKSAYCLVPQWVDIPFIVNAAGTLARTHDYSLMIRCCKACEPTLISFYLKRLKELSPLFSRTFLIISNPSDG